MSESWSFDMPPSRTSLNPKLFREIDKIKKTAAYFNLGYLTTNHVGNFDSVLLINRMVGLASVSGLTDSLFDKPDDFEVFINPKVEQGWQKEDVE